MGARGASASSDAVLTVDSISRLGDVVAIARRTRRIALQSVLAGMGMSLAAMGVAAAGLLPAVGRFMSPFRDLPCPVMIGRAPASR